MNQTSIHRTINPVINLEWLGWRTNTLQLMNAGWQISVSENIHQRSLDMAIKHPNIKIQGISRGNAYNYMQMMHTIDLNVPLRFSMQLARSINIASQTQEYTWKPVIASPQYVKINTEYKNLEDFALFETLPPKEQQIVISKPTLTEVLQMALEHQAPKQKELRHKTRSKMGAILRVAA